MSQFKHRDMQDFTMDYDLPRGDSDVHLRFGMQIVDDKGTKSYQFRMAVVAKPSNTIATIVSRIHLFEGTMTNCFKLNSRILTRDRSRVWQSPS